MILSAVISSSPVSSLNYLVQIKENIDFINIYLMQINPDNSENTEWIGLNPYLYLNTRTQVMFGGGNQKPSLVNGYPLQLHMLVAEIEDKLWKYNSICLSKQQYPNVRSVIKPEYFVNFKYEMI